jgi:tetratricopeptide (TPR) repeat protein
MKKVCIIVAAAVLLAGATAFADAKQHFLAGQDYYTQGRYEKAISEFEEAYRLDPRPLLLYNIAQAWEKLGDLRKSVDYLKKYLEADPNNEERTALLNKLASLQERLDKTGILIKCAEANATVYVDGKEVGKTPIAGVVKIDTGAHKIQVSKQGFEDFKMSVAVTEGQSMPVEVTLEPGQAGPPPAVVVAPPTAKPAGEGETKVDEGKTEVETDTGKKIQALDVVPWVIAGVGVVGVGVGWGALGSMAKGAQPKASLKETDYAKWKTDQDAAHKKALIADIVGGASAAIAAAGVIWGVVRIVQKKGGESAEPAAGAQVSFAPVIGDRTGGVAAVVEF